MINKFSNIVLNVPHASMERYSEGWKGSAFMFPLVKRWTDWHTDLLFAPTSDIADRVHMVRFPFSRFHCDAERLLDDPLKDKGQGIAYTSFEDFTRDVDDKLQIKLIDLWRKHQDRLKSLITDTQTLVIDCHSFPSDISDVEVCLGYNNDWSKPCDDMIGFIDHLFSMNDIKLAINDPYSNSITPDKDFPYTSFMLEINKRCYMYEDTLELNQIKFQKLNILLNKLYLSLLE